MSLLEQYASYTGLKVNYEKSSMIPINLEQQEALDLAQLMNCQIASMPFTYLGLPMGTTKPTMKDFAPLIDRIERRLSATVSFLSYGDSLVFGKFCAIIPAHILHVLTCHSQGSDRCD